MKSRRFILYDPVRLQQDRGRDLEPQRFGRLQIDHQFEFRRPLDRQVGGFGALENLVHVASSAAV
jgi:hypothetical protein